MSAPSARYEVRTGYVYTDVSGATARAYGAGETLTLPVAVGDRAHQLQRVAESGATPDAADPSAPRLARGKRTAQGGAA